MSEGGENREKSDEAKLQMSELEQDDLSHEERESKRRKLDNGEESAQQIVSRQSSPAPNPLKEEEPLNCSEQIPPKSPILSVPSPKRSSPRPDIVGVPEPSDVLNVLPAATLGPIDGTDNELLEQPCSASIGSFAPPVMKDEVIEMADGTVSEATPVPDKNESEMVKAGDVSTPAAADSPAREKDEILSAKGKTKSALASKSQTAKGKKAPAKKGRAKTKVEELKGSKARSASVSESRDSTPPVWTDQSQFTSPSGAPIDLNTVYCICRKPDTDDDEGLMVGCESCDGWFHASCVGLDEEMVGLLDVYICKSCERSGFCSSPCAFRYSQAMLGAITNKTAIKQLSKALTSFPRPKLGVTVEHHMPAKSETSIFSVYDDTQTQLLTLQKRQEAVQKTILRIQKRQALLHIAVDRCEQLPAIAPTETEESQQKGKKRKAGRPTDDKPCGWEASLIAEDEEVEELVKGEGEEMEVVAGEREVCMLPRRKCDRHQGWQKTVAVSLDLELATLTRTYESLQENQRLIEEASQALKISEEARELFLTKRQAVKRK
ncbi:compass component spp1 [Cryptococcus deuterogattii 99/473]|uniref:Compass component spp1 n=1 Tax=Cryptococcus deuterogattii Ram5 TaxID=1296110 RepID=A0A0D0VAM7_9TREE|nr:compass component spp1 [Cryptococcus deuterogattii Ram5]KIR73315.1 compass component spp1 [Cryptococcus deuterogattii CA1014]KIY60026.1 compass component spp1 [Cryptococcus deuterogattii 99/473]